MKGKEKKEESRKKNFCYTNDYYFLANINTTVVTALIKNKKKTKTRKYEIQRRKYHTYIYIYFDMYIQTHVYTYIRLNSSFKTYKRRQTAT